MPSMSTEPSDIFFTGAQNPRHGSVMIGWMAHKPVYLEFDTPEIALSETRTTVRRPEGPLPSPCAWYLCLTYPRMCIPGLPQRTPARRLLRVDDGHAHGHGHDRQQADAHVEPRRPRRRRKVSRPSAPCLAARPLRSPVCLPGRTARLARLRTAPPYPR